MNKFGGKIYYITRTWEKYKDSKTCSHIRAHYAALLSKYGELCVVTPNYKSNEIIIGDDIISFPFKNSFASKINTLLQYLLVKEDYLDSWTISTYNYMKNIVSCKDIIFSVTGGDLSSVKLASMLKSNYNCKVIINFSDPVDGIKINGYKSEIYKGFDRSKIAYNYMKNADAFITSSKTYLESLNSDSRYTNILKFNHYYGIANDYNYSELDNIKKPHDILNIVYGGTMGKIQNAEIGYKAFNNIDDIKMTYLCSDYKTKQKKMPSNNVFFSPLLNKTEYNNYILENCDVGFVSLMSPFAGVYVPSKIFDYINLGVPILASLPDGDAKNIINNNGYGFASKDGDIEALRANAKKLSDIKIYSSIRTRILSDRNKWNRENTDNDFYKIVDDILGRF